MDTPNAEHDAQTSTCAICGNNPLNSESHISYDELRDKLIELEDKVIDLLGDLPPYYRPLKRN